MTLPARCPHSTAPGARASQCSLCAGATPRIVEVVGAEVLVDGVAERTVQPQAWSPSTRAQQRKGGRR